jgi:DNA integrity scanning protein DisA with diadenylate cyclase activity
MSHSKLAIKPAINMVIIAKTKSQKNEGRVRELNRISKKTPAVTSVEEWTREETGVGAAIAAGSQEEKGIWALFVINVRTINSESNIVDSFLERKSQLTVKETSLIERRKKTSPNRFTKNVVIPATELEYLI